VTRSKTDFVTIEAQLQLGGREALLGIDRPLMCGEGGSRITMMKGRRIYTSRGKAVVEWEAERRMLIGG